MFNSNNVLTEQFPSINLSTDFDNNDVISLRSIAMGLECKPEEQNTQQNFNSDQGAENN